MRLRLIVIIIGGLAPGPAPPCDRLAEKFMRRYLLERVAAATTQFDFVAAKTRRQSVPLRRSVLLGAVPVRRRVRSGIVVDHSRPIGYEGSASVGALARLAIRKETVH